MSRIIESENDTDNELSNQSSEISIPQKSKEQSNDTNNNPYETSHDRQPVNMERKLEHYIRKISQMGLGEDGYISSENENPSNNNLSQFNDKIRSKLKSEEVEKVQIKFVPIGSIPPIKPSICKISSRQRFSMVIAFLEKKLKVRHVYCYINNSFAPSPQQIVGDLWNQFKINDELIVSYCGSVAFG